MIEVIISTRLRPTEDPEKVLKALKNLFPDVKFEVKNDVVLGRAQGIGALRRFIEIIGREGIGPRTLEVLRQGRRGRSITIPIDKEVATVSRISFDEEGEMGPIWLEVRGDVEEFERLVASTIPGESGSG